MHPIHTVLCAFYQSLRNDETRTQAAEQLREAVSAASRELSGETLNKFTGDINRHIFQLTQGSEVSEKLGAIMAIEQLVDYEPEENTSKIARFSHYLRIALAYGDPQVMVPAAKALGRLASASSSVVTEFVDFEVKRALEWLQGDRNEARRHAAVLVLKELAVNAPTLIYSYVQQILELIWTALRDSKQPIREAAAELLSQSLRLLRNVRLRFALSGTSAFLRRLKKDFGSTASRASMAHC